MASNLANMLFSLFFEYQRLTFCGYLLERVPNHRGGITPPAQFFNMSKVEIERKMQWVVGD